MKVSITMGGVKDLSAKYSQRANFLGGDGMREFLKDTGARVRKDIEDRISSFTPGDVPDLSREYKKQKQRQVGHVYPILIKTGFSLASLYVRVHRGEKGRWEIRVWFAGNHPSGPRVSDIMRWHATGAGRLPKRDWAVVSAKTRADSRADLRRRIASL